MRNFSIDQDKFFAGWFKTLWGNRIRWCTILSIRMWHSRKHSPLEPGVSARRWIGKLRLHAGKYILGITAPTGTGVQARF